MTDALKTLIRQPYWIIALILGGALIAFPYIRIDDKNTFATQEPSFFLPIWAGLGLVVLSAAAFVFSVLEKYWTGGGLDLSRVKDSNGALLTTVKGCEIRVVVGQIEQYAQGDHAVVLPCNEYFDRHCIYDDPKGALSAFVNQEFKGQVDAFVTYLEEERSKRLGEGTEEQKTATERAKSFGPGKCLLLQRPLGRLTPIALVSTATRRAGQGIVARTSYLFDGLHELARCLANTHVTEIILPILGAGRGGIDPSLAFVTLLLAVAEVARYWQGAQRLKKVTIVVFQRDPSSPPQVAKIVIRRALALVGAGD